MFIPNSDFSVQRVRERVRHGGHNVPVADVQRRYARSVGNVLAYSEACDYTACYDNSTAMPHFVFTRVGTALPRVQDPRVYNRIVHDDPLPELSTSPVSPDVLVEPFVQAVADMFRKMKGEDVVVADENRRAVSRPTDDLLELLRTSVPGIAIVEGVCSLDDPAFARFGSPRGVIFDGRYVRDVRSWREAYEVLLCMLNNVDPAKFDTLPTQEFFRRHFVAVEPGRRYARHYVAKFGSAANIRAKEVSGKAAFSGPASVVCRLLEYFGIAPDRVALRG